MSGSDEESPLVILPGDLAWVVDTLADLTATDMPTVAVVGGIGVTFRLAARRRSIRATADLDVVARGDAQPTALMLLTQRDDATATENGVELSGTKIDVMETYPLTDDDVEGIADAQRLFVTAHGWAFESAAVMSIGVAQGATVTIPVARPAGLVAMKSHAIGHARAARRTNKRAGDLYDLYALLEAYDADGSVGTALANAPWGLGRLVRAVIEAELLAAPERTVREMAAVAEEVIELEQFTDVIEGVAARLRVGPN